jgi:hypothetical protein
VHVKRAWFVPSRNLPRRREDVARVKPRRTFRERGKGSSRERNLAASSSVNAPVSRSPGETFLEEHDALRLAAAAAVDSVPLARMRALSAIADLTEYGASASVSDVQRSLKRGNWWAAKWECDALTAIGLVKETRTEDDALVYELAGDYKTLYASVGFSCASLSTTGKDTEGGLHIRRGSSPHGAAESDDGIPF